MLQHRSWCFHICILNLSWLLSEKCMTPNICEMQNHLSFLSHIPQSSLLSLRTLLPKLSVLLMLLLLLSRFSRVQLLCDSIEGSPPGSPVSGILQARTLEWVAISFSNAWKWKVKVKSLSCVRLLATPWTTAYQAPPFMGFSRQEYWSGSPLPSPTCIWITSNQHRDCIHMQVFNGCGWMNYNYNAEQ